MTLNGVPSRNLLVTSGLPFTSFESDTNDKTNDVWEKVFVNLNDSGNFFHWGANSVPPAYGPILLVIDVNAFSDCQDVAVCLRSAGATRFNQIEESLTTVAEVESLFKGDPGTKECAYFKSREELKELFPQFEGLPELSCTVTAEKIDIEHVNKIIVDPIELNGVKLLDWINTVASNRDKHLAAMVEQRHGKRYEMLNDLVIAVNDGICSFKELFTNPRLKDWAKACEKNNLHYQIRRYSNYMRTGTLPKLITSKKKVS